MTRQLRVAVLSGLFLLSSLVTVRSIKAQNAATVNAPPPQASVQSQRPDPAPERQADQMTNIPYYTLRDGLSSTLTLDNNAPTPTQITITIFNLEGRAQVLDSMTLDPHSVKQIELIDVISSELFDEGSLTIAYFGKEMDVTCQVSVYSLEKRVSFESREQGMMDFQTSSANGILWLPQKGAEGFLAITNISKNRVTVQVSVATQTKEIELYSHETHVVKLGEEFGLNAPAAALVKLSQNGLPGDILTTGYVMDLKSGYSSAFTMFDPKNPRSSHLAGAHFRIGPPDPSEGFPPGTTFTSPLLLANVSQSPVKAHLSVDYTVPEKQEMTLIDPEKGTTAEKFSTVAVEDLIVAPGEVRRIELSQQLTKLEIPTPVSEAGVDVAYEAPPGALIAHLVSADQTGDYSFEVPMKDPTAWNAMIEGINPWSLEDDTRTVLHLKNTTDQPVQAWTTFTFVGGSYNLPLLSFQPYQTISIDIRALKDSKKPDARGIPFPADATHGQAVWFPKTPYSLVGRAEQTNIVQGIARSFSCQVDCCNNYFERVCVSTAPCAPNVWYPNTPISVSGLTLIDGSSGNLMGYDYGQDCNANPFGPTILSSPTWTYNSSLISVNSSGKVTYVGAGSTSVGITSSPLTYYDWYTGCICHVYIYSSPAYTTVSNEQAPVNDIQLDITNRSYILVGTDPNLHGANAFFATVSPSGGTLTGSSSDSKDTFAPVQSGGPGLYVTTTDQSQTNSDRLLTFTYTVNGASVHRTVNVTARKFSYATNNSPSNACGLGYGYTYSYVYTPYTHPDHAAVAPGIGISGTAVSESFNPTTIACGNITGNGALDQNSEFTDRISFCSNAPLPTCSSTNTQTLNIAGYYVRTNSLTISNTGLTYTNQGPTQ